MVGEGTVTRSARGDGRRGETGGGRWEGMVDGRGGKGSRVYGGENGRRRRGKRVQGLGGWGGGWGSVKVILWFR